MDKIYFSSSIKDEKKDDLIHMAKIASLPFGYYVIAASEKDDEILCAYSHFDVNKGLLNELNLDIIGIAKNKIAAKYLMFNIIEDALNVVDENGLKEYFKNGVV